MNVRFLPQDTLYTKYCNVAEVELRQSARTSGCFKDFLDAQSLLDADVQRDNILPQNNINWPLLDDPAINDAMKAAALTPTGPARNQAWAKVEPHDRRAGPGVPWRLGQDAGLGRRT